MKYNNKIIYFLLASFLTCNTAKLFSMAPHMVPHIEANNKAAETSIDVIGISDFVNALITNIKIKIDPSLVEEIKAKIYNKIKNKRKNLKQKSIKLRQSVLSEKDVTEILALWNNLTNLYVSKDNSLEKFLNPCGPGLDDFKQSFKRKISLCYHPDKFTKDKALREEIFKALTIEHRIDPLIPLHNELKIFNLIQHSVNATLCIANYNNKIKIHKLLLQHNTIDIETINATALMSCYHYIKLNEAIQPLSNKKMGQS